jgi:hypothetical protein
VDLARSNRSRAEREARELNDRSALGADLEREVWQLAVADRIQQALEALPMNERRAVQLAYFGGLSYREVASELGEPEGTVKSRIRSALKTLGRALRDLDPAAEVEERSEGRPTVARSGSGPRPPVGGAPPGAALRAMQRLTTDVLTDLRPLGRWTR